MIDSIIDSQESFIFTNDEDYIKKLISKKSGNEQEEQDANTLLVVEIRKRIESYYSIVLKNLRDTIPRIIQHFFVK